MYEEETAELAVFSYSCRTVMAGSTGVSGLVQGGWSRARRARRIEERGGAIESGHQM
jgi:hypothetical protein